MSPWSGVAAQVAGVAVEEPVAVARCLMESGAGVALLL
jgi:hypothetical protein